MCPFRAEGYSRGGLGVPQEFIAWEWRRETVMEIKSERWWRDDRICAIKMLDEIRLGIRAYHSAGR